MGAILSNESADWIRAQRAKGANVQRPVDSLAPRDLGYSAPIGEKYPLQVTCDDTNVYVRSGYWHRDADNIEPGSIDTYVDDPDAVWTLPISGFSDGYNYVYAKLKSDSGTKDTGLDLSDAVLEVANATTYPPTSDTDLQAVDYAGKIDLNKRARELAIVHVVTDGTSPVTRVDWIWQGQHGDIEESAPVEFDGDTRHVSTGTQYPVRKTLARNPETTNTGLHHNEAQLYAIENAEKGNAGGAVASEPYIDVDANGNGNLAWAAIDSRRSAYPNGPAYRSIDINAGHPSSAVTQELEGFAAATAPETTSDDTNTLIPIRFSKAGIWANCIAIRYVPRSTLKGDSGAPGSKGDPGDPADAPTGYPGWTPWDDHFDGRYWPKKGATPDSATYIVTEPPPPPASGSVLDGSDTVNGAVLASIIHQLCSAVVELKTKLNVAIGIITDRDGAGVPP